MIEARRLAPPISPGSVLRKEVQTRLRITQDELAQALGVSRHSVSELVNERRSITPDMALRLGYVLGTDPYFWLNLQRDVDLHNALMAFDDIRPKLKVLRESGTGGK